ncbi:MAG TPA: 1,4-beta-xylanase, partial [Terriglobales bacterium]|nr:1,4-beta-xylanase [Terriglobales bacterium]
MKQFRLLICLVFLLSLTAFAETQRWSAEKANAWYQQQPWLVGSNYTPSNAINELEMWQAETFDPKEIDKELGWAQGIGMNTMRVFLHDLPWQQNSPGFKQRIDTFLMIAEK